MSTLTHPLLSVTNLSVHYPVGRGVVRALDNVSIEVGRGEILAVVGESGCGKTTLAKAILGLQAIHSGTVSLNNESVLENRKDLGRRVGMVWQDPYASLDPRWKVSRSIAEPATMIGKTIDVPELMREVGLDERFKDRYPHELSGGQRQRVAIGRALALQPPLVICDEPTSALDLSIRAQILNLLRDIKEKRECSFLYISHDLMTVRFIADRIAVMYMGQVVETGPTEQIFSSPRHPYTKALLEAAPTLEKLMSLPEPLEGEIPDPTIQLSGCKFASRCFQVQESCLKNSPHLLVEQQRSALCNFPLGVN